MILPTNSSLSVTLDQDHLRSTTTSRADPSFEKDRLWLNGKEEEIKDGGRLSTCIREMKALRAKVEEKGPNEPKVRLMFFVSMPFTQLLSALNLARPYLFKEQLPDSSWARVFRLGICCTRIFFGSSL